MALTRALRRVSVCACIIASAVHNPIVQGQGAPTDTTPSIKFGGFVDGYYAFDMSRPATMDRSFAGGALFTTQPARHNEFNVNLAFIEAKLDAPGYRGRLALQTGTSVQSNYSGEPANGQVSGPTLGRLIQEAVVGVKVGDNVWVDGGIFYSHMGMESWASRDNPVYSRSLVAEYSPYYQSGVKATWTPSGRFTAQLDVVNGWQNISENNSGKGAGVRLDFTPASSATMSYYNFFSDESGNRLRTFNGVGVKYAAGKATLIGQFDVGSQAKSSATGGTATWYGFTAIARAQVAPRVGLSARVERFDDKNQIVMATGSHTLASGDAEANPSFRGNGASVGLDVSPAPRVLWRTEVRVFSNNAAVFPDGVSLTPRKSSGFAVTSLALTF